MVLFGAVGYNRGPTGFYKLNSRISKDIHKTTRNKIQYPFHSPSPSLMSTGSRMIMSPTSHYDSTLLYFSILTFL